MSNDRDTIFSAIKKAVNTAKELFAHKLETASGKFCDSVNALVQLLLSEGHSFGYVDPELAHFLEGEEGISFDTEYDMAKVDDYQFGITKASAGIAETGTIMLKDDDTSARLGALSPWVHVAVIQEENIVPTILDAIKRFGEDPNIIFCTGPSKTADVEGILIQGVHGPGVQVALVV